LVLLPGVFVLLLLVFVPLLPLVLLLVLPLAWPLPEVEMVSSFLSSSLLVILIGSSASEEFTINVLFQSA
jgi:hypothetical protein